MVDNVEASFSFTPAANRPGVFVGVKANGADRRILAAVSAVALG